MKNFLNRVFNRVKLKAVSFIRASSWNGGFEDPFDSINLKAFKNSLYLFIGVSMIRETVSSIPLEMYRIKGKNGDVEEVLDDPLLALINRPNYRQTQKEFWKLAVAYYLLSGETFWYFYRSSENAIPESMVNLRPDHVQVLLSQDKQEIVGYEFNQADGNVIKLRAEDVLHIKNIDPINPIRGIGVVRPATQRIITEREASKHQADTFKNQGRPDVAVFTNVDLNEEQAEEARLKWQKVYGQDNGGQAGFFGADIKDLKVLNVNPKEMDFIASQNFLRDDILAALHVPKAMITSDDVNLANSKTARINYLKEAVLPVLDTFLDVVNNKWLTDKDQDKFVTYESPVQEDRELLLKEAVELKKAGIIKINEARALMNYEEIPEGDVLSESSSSISLAMKMAQVRKTALQVLKNRKVLYRKFIAIEEVAKLFESTKKSVKRERNSVFNTPELKNAFIKAFNGNIDKKSSNIKENLDVFNDGLYKRIVKRMEEFGINADYIFEVSEEISTAKKIFIPIMQDMYKSEGQKVMDSIANGFENKASEQFFVDSALLLALEHRAEFFITSMLDTDWKQLKSIIVAGLKDGKGVPEIARDMRKYFDDMSVSRANTIARTETGRLISSATNEAYIQSEIVTGKEWLTAEDDKVRDVAGTINDHVINHGVIVGTKDAFPNGEKFPGELTINCRCALAPAV